MLTLQASPPQGCDLQGRLALAAFVLARLQAWSWPKLDLRWATGAEKGWKGGRHRDPREAEDERSQKV